MKYSKLTRALLLVARTAPDDYLPRGLLVTTLPPLPIITLHPPLDAKSRHPNNFSSSF
jgi:hypothetical protein